VTRALAHALHFTWTLATGSPLHEKITSLFGSRDAIPVLHKQLSLVYSPPQSALLSPSYWKRRFKTSLGVLLGHLGLAKPSRLANCTTSQNNDINNMKLTSTAIVFALSVLAVAIPAPEQVKRAVDCKDCKDRYQFCFDVSVQVRNGRKSMY
jgi:hypothetical protein